MRTSSACTPCSSSSLFFTWFACQSASALPRVPIRSGFIPCPRLALVQAEKMPYGVNRCQPPAHLAAAAQLLRRLLEHSFDQFFGDVRDAARAPPAKRRHLRQFFADEHLRGAYENGREDRPPIEPASSAARHDSNFAMCSATMDFGSRNFRFASLFVLLDDFAQVVNVVEIQIVKPRRLRPRRCAARPDPPRTSAGLRARQSRVRASRASALALRRPPKSPQYPARRVRVRAIPTRSLRRRRVSANSVSSIIANGSRRAS